jgi:hypothetical protein
LSKNCSKENWKWEGLNYCDTRGTLLHKSRRLLIYLFILTPTWQMIFDLQMLNLSWIGQYIIVKYLFYILCDKAQAKKEKISSVWSGIVSMFWTTSTMWGSAWRWVFNRCPEDVWAVYRHTGLGSHGGMLECVYGGCGLTMR